MIEAKLSELPNGWVCTKLEVLAEKINPGFPSGKHNKENRGIPHIRPMNISLKGEIDLANVKYVETSNYESLLKGDVLFNNTNSPEMLGKTTYLKQDTCWAYSNHMTRIRLSPQFLEPAWIAYYLHHLFLKGFFKMNCVHHVNQASINSGFLSQKVPVPLAPLPEQRRIVARIEKLFSRLDAGVAALQRAKAQLRRYRQAILKAAVEGRLTKEWRKAHPEVEPAEKLLERILAERRKIWKERLSIDGKDHRQFNYKEPVPQFPSDLGPLPKRWIWASYDVLTSFITSGSRAWKKFLGKGDAVFILLQNLRERQLILDNPTFIDAPEGAEADRTRILNGDILISIVGNTGITCLVREIGDAYVSQSVALTRPINLIN
ncbi:MAG: restriction endonuclease subunit S [Methanothrix sp.]